MKGFNSMKYLILFITYLETIRIPMNSGNIKTRNLAIRRLYVSLCDFSKKKVNVPEKKTHIIPHTIGNNILPIIEMNLFISFFNIFYSVPAGLCPVSFILQLNQLLKQQKVSPSQR